MGYRYTHSGGVQLIALGVISVLDLEDVGPEPLVNELKIDPAMGAQIIAAASEESKQLAAESKKKQAEDVLEQQQQKLQVPEEKA